MFLLAITCAFVSKTLSGSYMNSMLTQIERQFNIPTSLVGFINGSFEIGNESFPYSFYNLFYL